MRRCRRRPPTGFPVRRTAHLLFDGGGFRPGQPQCAAAPREGWHSPPTSSATRTPPSPGTDAMALPNTATPTVIPSSGPDSPRPRPCRCAVRVLIRHRQRDGQAGVEAGSRHPQARTTARRAQRRTGTRSGVDEQPGSHQRQACRHGGSRTGPARQRRRPGSTTKVPVTGIGRNHTAVANALTPGFVGTQSCSANNQAVDAERHRERGGRAATRRRLPNRSSGNMGCAPRRWVPRNAVIVARAMTVTTAVCAAGRTRPSTSASVSAAGPPRPAPAPDVRPGRRRIA